MDAKKTTIQFPPDLYEQMARLSAVRELSGLSLPVGTPEEMERESVPVIEPLP